MLGVVQSATSLQVPRADAPLGAGGEGADREAAAGRRAPRCERAAATRACTCCSPGATGFLGKEILAQAAVDRAHRARSSRWCGPRRSATRRPKEVLKVAVARSSAARCCSSGCTSRGARAAQVPLRRRRHREAGPRHRPRPSSQRLRPSLTHVIHCAASVVLRRHLRELLPRQRAGLPQRARLLARPCSTRPGSPFVAPRRHRDVVHPRAQEALHRARRARSSSRGTSTTTSTSSRRRWRRSRPTAAMIERRAARGAAPALDRDRRLAHRQQPRRHQGRERARSTPSAAPRRPWSTPPRAT